MASRRGTARCTGSEPSGRRAEIDLVDRDVGALEQRNDLRERERVQRCTPSNCVPVRKAGQPPGRSSVTSMSGMLPSGSVRPAAVRLGLRRGELVRRELVGRELVRGELVGRELVGRELVGRELVGRELVGRELVRRALCRARPRGRRAAAPSTGCSRTEPSPVPTGIVSELEVSAGRDRARAISSAPRSHLPPVGCGRATPRWSAAVTTRGGRTRRRVRVDRGAARERTLRLRRPAVVGERPELGVHGEDRAARRATARRRLHDVRAGEGRASGAVGPGWSALFPAMIDSADGNGSADAVAGRRRSAASPCSR